jgi:hypothetical protein
MKRWIPLVLTLPVLALMWAALHDVLRGEPDPRQELVALTLCAPLLVLLAWRTFLPAKGGARP